MLKVYTHADEFLKDNKHLLVPRQLELNIIWKNAHSHKCIDDGFYGVMAQDGDSYVLAIQTTPFPICIATFGDECTSLLEEVYAHSSHHADISRSIGSLADITSYTSAGNRDYVLIDSMLLYELKQVIHTPLAAGHMINAKDSDFDSWDWSVRFHEDCHIDNGHTKESYTQNIVNSGCLYYLVVDDQIVCMAANHRDTDTAKGVGYVYTPDNLRGKGYAMALMTYLSEYLLESTDAVFLYADADNPISNHVYQKIGYKHVGDMAKIQLKEK